MRAFLAAALLLAPAAAQADAGVLAALNAARAQGCGGLPGIASALAADPRLDAAARMLGMGHAPDDALARAGYRTIKWSLADVAGTSEPDLIAAQVARGACARLVDVAFTQAGIYRRDKQTWVLFAAPFVLPPAEAAPAVARRVLALVNAARAAPRRCGDKDFAATGPLKLNAVLDRAAFTHAADMALKDFFSHTGSDGSSVLVRATRFGYDGRALGENIAAGQSTPEAAVDAWLNSPSHCETLMTPRYREMGIAYAVNPASKMVVYWAQVFGTPR